MQEEDILLIPIKGSKWNLISEKNSEYRSGYCTRYTYVVICTTRNSKFTRVFFKEVDEYELNKSNLSKCYGHDGSCDIDFWRILYYPRYENLIMYYEWKENVK